MTIKNLVAVADCDGIRFQPLQERAVLREKFKMAALGTFEHDVPALRAVGKKRQLGEDVAIDHMLAAKALDAAGGAGHGLFGRLVFSSLMLAGLPKTELQNNPVWP
jgi:hypothetical protein